MCEMKLEFREGRNKRMKQTQKMEDKDKRMKKGYFYIRNAEKRKKGKVP